MPNIPDDFLRGGAGLNPGARLGFRPSLSEIMVALAAPRGMTLYVEKDVIVNSNVTRDGSLSAPFSDPRDAVLAAAELNPTFLTPVTIKLGPGTFDLGDDSLEIHTDYLRLVGEGENDITIILSSEVPLVLTNATPASYATYHSSGTYSDLVNQGDAGPRSFVSRGIKYQTTHVSGRTIECLGVKGDASSTTTDFGYDSSTYQGIIFDGMVVLGNAGPYLYARNAGVIGLINCYGGLRYDFINCGYVESQLSAVPEPRFTYDSTDVNGEPDGGLWGYFVRCCYQMGDVYANVEATVDVHDTALDDVYVDGATASVTLKNCTVDDIDIDGTGAEVTMWGGVAHCSNTGVAIEGGCSFTAHGATFAGANGDVIKASGTGDVLLNNCYVGGDATNGGGGGTFVMNGGRVMGTPTAITHTQGDIGT